MMFNGEINMNILKEFKYQSNVLFYISITAILLFISIVFSDELYGIFGKDNYVSIHLILEIFMVVVTMAISIQIWLTSRFTLINKDIYLGAIFLLLSLIAIVHLISYKGMPYFITESTPYEATWFYIISRLIFPIGLLFTFLLKEKEASYLFRWGAYVSAIVLSCAIIMIVYSPEKILPPLVIEGTGTTGLKNFLQYTAAAIQIVFIIFVIRHFKDEPKKSMLFITSSVYLLISDILFTTYEDVYDIFNFTGHIFQLFAYIVIFRAIYFSAVEQPYFKIKDINRVLEKSEKKMYNMAFYDEITDLPNERHVLKVLKDNIDNKNPMAVIVFEIDRLTTIKASIGTYYSEQMLRIAAERLRNEMPESYLLGKLRVDQFVVIVPNVKSESAQLDICKKLHKIFEEPFNIQHYSLIGQINVGISQFPNDAQSGSNLLKFAQFAMYEASRVPEHTLFYKSEMTEERSERILLENDLYQAILRDELFLQYQPQLSISTGEIQSVEALVRWQHPTRGLISPAEFIPIAEQSGVIIPFGKWVLETACRQTKELQEIMQRKLKVAVNLSLGQLFQEKFVDEVRAILKKTGLEPQYLELEITESMTMNTNEIRPILDELKQLGVTVAVDDFGTGYSSLSYLNNFPIDCLKIDRGFVNKINEQTEKEPLVDMIISMAKHLKLNVVAEGIETLEQFKYIQENECDIVQGFLISKPVDHQLLITTFEDIQNKANYYLQTMK